MGNDHLLSFIATTIFETPKLSAISRRPWYPSPSMVKTEFSVTSFVCFAKSGISFFTVYPQSFLPFISWKIEAAR